MSYEQLLLSLSICFSASRTAREVSNTWPILSVSRSRSGTKESWHLRARKLSPGDRPLWSFFYPPELPTVEKQCDHSSACFSYSNPLDFPVTVEISVNFPDRFRAYLTNASSTHSTRLKLWNYFSYLYLYPLTCIPSPGHQVLRLPLRSISVMYPLFLSSRHWWRISFDISTVELQWRMVFTSLSRGYREKGVGRGNRWVPDPEAKVS